MALVALAVVGIAAWVARPHAEPRYRGYPVRAWLDALGGRPAPAMQPEDLRAAGAALERMGPAAYPALQRALIDERPVRQFFFETWLRLPAGFRDRVPRPVPGRLLREVTVELVRRWAPENRKALAAQVIPALIERVRQPGSHDRVALVSGVLRELHPDAESIMPALREWLRDPDPELREATLFMLTDYGRQAAPALPELTAALTDSHQQNLIFAVGLLGRIGADARAAVPSLEKLLGTGFDDGAVAQALWAVDRQTNTALRYLTNAIEDRSGNAAYTLGTMGPAGRPALPFLLAALDSKTGNVRMNSARAVARIAPELIPRAVDAVAQVLAAGCEARPSDMDAHGAAWYAASVLREFGTNAASARDIVERGARSSQADIADECRRALAALDGPGPNGNPDAKAATTSAANALGGGSPAGPGE